MALDTADFRQAFLYGATTRLYQASRALQLVTRPDPGAYFNAEELKVWVNETNHGAGTTYVDGATFATTVANATRPSGKYVDFETDEWKLWREQITLKEQRYTGLDTVRTMGEELGDAVTVAVDESVFATINDDIAAANLFAMSGTINTSGVASADDTGMEMLEFIAYQLEKANIIGESSRNPDARAFVAVPPEVNRAIRRSYRENGGDTIKREFLYGGLRPVFDGKVAIIQTKATKAEAGVTETDGPGSISNKTAWQCPFGVPSAAFFGEREPVVAVETPSTPGGGAYWETDLLRIWGTKIIQSDRIFKAYVAQS